MTAPDVIVAWLQNDYGTLGRAGEAIAHALVRNPAAGRVAYVEPFLPGPGDPELGARDDHGLLVFRGRGTPPAGTHEVAHGVLATAGLRDPILLTFGVAATSWWLHHEFAPVSSRTVLVAYDKLAEWEALAAQRPMLERVRTQLIRSSDVVCGLSQGAIGDLPGARYVGHGVDAVWADPDVDRRPEPSDLAPLQRPRAVYVGALSMRFDAEAVRAVADAGIDVALVGLAPSPAVGQLAATHPRVHLLGERPPELAAAYLLHCDVAIIPHTDEPFTRSMEPHKAYNYAAAGLRTVTLNAAHAPALGSFLESTHDVPTFVGAVGRALEAGRLSADETAAARALTWDRVAAAILAEATGPGVAADVRPLAGVA